MMKLTSVLEKHLKWLRGETDGECADLRSANLCLSNRRTIVAQSSEIVRLKGWIKRWHSEKRLNAHTADKLLPDLFVEIE